MPKLPLRGMGEAMPWSEKSSICLRWLLADVAGQAANRCRVDGLGGAVRHAGNCQPGRLAYAAQQRLPKSALVDTLKGLHHDTFAGKLCSQLLGHVLRQIFYRGLGVDQVTACLG